MELNKLIDEMMYRAGSHASMPTKKTQIMIDAEWY